MDDYLFRGNLSDFDPDLQELIQLENERQYRKLIMIPSESTAPIAVRKALGSAFQNIYAEGYPPEESRYFLEDEILDYVTRLAEYRRYSDPRYYKGVEYADVVEALARRRCAETFATNGVTADELFVNVQALSGSPANNAVYHALVEPGDRIMGMNLLHGGHLSHGSSVHRSGKYYEIISYSVDPETEQIDYDEVESLARKEKPKLIIAGVSSYPWSLNWKRFRTIADAVGAYLLADIAHVAGLIVGGVYPSPVGYADVITSTTHKTLCGPRGAIILATDYQLARKIDRAVFPGEQGGPHVNVFAAMALAFKLAQTAQFRLLQEHIVRNCVALTDRLAKRGIRIPYGGTDTHLTNLDARSIKGANDASLNGDLATRILDIAGIVTNRNTIPGDSSARNPSGIRLGTPWLTQRGFKEEEMQIVADIIVDILQGITPYYQGQVVRAKVEFQVLEDSKIKVRDLADKAGKDEAFSDHGYPHFYYLDDTYPGDWVAFDISGENVREFLNFSISAEIEGINPGESRATCIHTPKGTVEGALTCMGDYLFKLSVPNWGVSLVASWLRDLSDGYVRVDEDLVRKMPGPVVVDQSKDDPVVKDCRDEALISEARGSHKPYFIGIEDGEGEALPAFQFEESDSPIKRTPVYEIHLDLGAKMVPFAGWEMPVRYGSVMEEHLAVRQSAGLFDVAHMGVYQAEGPDALVFLDSVCGNDIASLDIGQSLYTHFLDPDAHVIDDLLVYRRGKSKYMLVVNAANDDKDWSWLNAVRKGEVKIDNQRPWAQAFGSGVVLRNLRDPKEGSDMRVDIALQGPRSRDILLSLGGDREKILKLKRTDLCDASIGGFDLVVARTGYTGEKMAFELFVHPDKAADLFDTLMKAGSSFDIQPCGLGARDSLRTEAGLPLYGHEMGGNLNLGVGEAGFGSYIKTYKPWFIGRKSYMEREEKRKGVVVRFRFDQKGVRMAHLGDPVLDLRGKVVGVVTSCAADSEGFLLGQAFVDKKYTQKGTSLLVFQGSPKKSSKAPALLNIGDRVTIPNQVTVINRFR